MYTHTTHDDGDIMVRQKTQNFNTSVLRNIKTQPPWRKTQGTRSQKLAVIYDAISTFIGLATGSNDIRLDLLGHLTQDDGP